MITTAAEPSGTGPVRRLRGCYRLWPALLGALLLLLASATGLVVGGASAGAATTNPTPAATSSGAASPSGAATGAAATFGIGPASATKLDGRSVLNFGASPGARATDHVAIENFGLTPLTLAVYAVDAENGTDGSFALHARTDPLTGAGGWIAIATPNGASTVTVPARSATILPITLSVPANAAPGDHSAGIVVSLTSQIKSNSGQLVNFEQRVGLRTFVRVSGDIVPKLKVESLKVSYRGSLNPFGHGTATISYTVKNTGNVNLSGHQVVTISGLLGSTGAVKSLANIPLLLPGSSYTVKTVAHNVWPQTSMTAKVKLAPLAVATDVDPGLQIASTSVSFLAVPWTLIVLIVILIALVVLFVLWRRALARRSRGGRHGGSAGRRVRQPVPTA